MLFYHLFIPNQNQNICAKPNKLLFYTSIYEGEYMINIVEECGRNAGKIWETLHSHGPLSETKLMSLTKLKEHEFYTAVGWLARENKICKDGNVYKLGETNLTNEIGEAAGKVYTVFETMNEVDVSELPQLTLLDQKETNAALGWLARENKIEALVPLPREFTVKFKT